MNKELYLVIADTFTALQNEVEGESVDFDTVITALADSFKEYDSEFDKVQFLNDCELARGRE